VSDTQKTTEVTTPAPQRSLEADLRDCIAAALRLMMSYRVR